MVEADNHNRTSLPLSSSTVYISRVFKRPRPWILGYLVLLFPALVSVPLLALPLLEWSRAPLFRAALEARSLDLLLDFFIGALADARFSAESSGGSPLLLLGICGVLVLWPLLKLLWVWVEGGTLVTYADSTLPSWPRFFEGCRRYFGPFLLLNILGLLIVVLFGGVSIALSIGGLSRLVPGLGWGGLIVGGLLVAVLATGVEVARAVIVVREDRHILRALRGARDVIRTYPLALLALIVASGLSYAMLFGVYRGLISWVPIPWWVLSFGVQQVYLIARLGVRLARQAGEVGLVSYAREDQE
jgi:hypothetical protein